MVMFSNFFVKQAIKCGPVAHNVYFLHYAANLD